MKILIISPTLDDLLYALRKKGHEAYSCYVEFPNNGSVVEPVIHPEWHIDKHANIDGISDGDCCFTTLAGAEHYIDKWDYVVFRHFNEPLHGVERIRTKVNYRHFRHEDIKKLCEQAE